MHWSVKLIIFNVVGLTAWAFFMYYDLWIAIRWSAAMCIILAIVLWIGLRGGFDDDTG